MRLSSLAIKESNSKLNTKLIGYSRYTVKRSLLKLPFKIFFISLIIGICFAILYPLFSVFPVVFNHLEELGNPDVIWMPMRPSTDSFRVAIRLVYGHGLGMLQSLFYSVAIAFVQVFMSALIGYALGRAKYKWANVVFFLVLFAFIVPPQSLLISQFLHFKHFDVFGIIRALTGGAIDLINQPYTLFFIALFGFGVRQSLFVFILRQFFKGMPTELEEAALIDGCGYKQTYFRIMLPNAFPALLTVAVLSFVWNYGDTYYTGYFHPEGPYLSNLLAHRFAPANVQLVLRAIETWQGLAAVTVFAFDAVKFAAVLIYLIPLLVIYFLLQKKFVQNFERSGIVG